MADLTRAQELVETVDQDDAFRAALEAAPTVAARRQILDARGFQDVGLEDMKAYVESKGGTLVAQDSGRELSEQELASVAAGFTDQEWKIIGFVGGLAILGTAAASA